MRVFGSRLNAVDTTSCVYSSVPCAGLRSPSAVGSERAGYANFNAPLAVPICRRLAACVSCQMRDTPASEPSHLAGGQTLLQPAGHQNPSKHVLLPRAPISRSLDRRQFLSLTTVGIACAAAQCSAARSEAAQQGSEEFSLHLESRVTEFTLANGLRFLVLERHNAPIVSCHTHANVGAFDEDDGQTGVAHLLEHMAFKGTHRIGTRDYRREAPLLDAMDELFYSLRDAEARGSAAEALRLSQQLVKLQAQAGEMVVPNEFGALLSRAGGVGLNATTSQDATKYFISLPVNKLALWFALEAERWREPVFRELYAEKRVVAEERRARVDDSPMGSFQEAFVGMALANNYRRPVIGYASDVVAMGRAEVQGFFSRHYGPRSLTISVVGDVNPSEVEQLAQKYFGQWEGRISDKTDLSASQGYAAEPLARPKEGPYYFERATSAGPVVMQAYYRPASSSDDAVALDCISDLLSGGRTARLTRNLVQTGAAYAASAITTWPGEKHPAALLLAGSPTAGRSLDSLNKQLRSEAHALADDGPTAAEVRRIKKAAKLSLLDAFRSNSSMAAALCSYTAMTGDWRHLLDDLARVEMLTQQDLRAVAGRTFAEDNCFTAFMPPLKASPLQA